MPALSRVECVSLERLNRNISFGWASQTVPPEAEQE